LKGIIWQWRRSQRHKIQIFRYQSSCKRRLSSSRSRRCLWVLKGEFQRRLAVKRVFLRQVVCYRQLEARVAARYVTARQQRNWWKLWRI